MLLYVEINGLKTHVWSLPQPVGWRIAPGAPLLLGALGAEPLCLARSASWTPAANPGEFEDCESHR